VDLNAVDIGALPTMRLVDLHRQLAATPCLRLIWRQGAPKDELRTFSTSRGGELIFTTPEGQSSHMPIPRATQLRALPEGFAVLDPNVPNRVLVAYRFEKAV
jgi:hypothetical protein